MPSSREDYVILSEVLRKMDLNENYVPSDREYKVVVSLLAVKLHKLSTKHLAQS